MRCSDSPPPIPSRFVAFAQRYRSRLLVSLPCGGRSRPAEVWAWSPGARPGSLRRRRGPPRFLDVPVAHMLRSRTPVESQRPGLLGPAMQPSAVVTTSASTTTNSRGSLTQPARSLCTLRSAGYPCTTQHSVPAGGQPLPGGIRNPPGRTEGFGAPWSAASPPSPGLAWRNTTIDNSSRPRSAQRSVPDLPLERLDRSGHGGRTGRWSRW